MKNRVLHVCTALIACLCLALMIPPISAAVSDKPAETEADRAPASPGGSELDKNIARWIEQLSEQQPFAAFRGADWKRYPLGPGTHGWVVIVEKYGEEIGYLVIHAKPDGGLILTEYGRGPYPLFSMKTLIRTLEQHGLLTPGEQAEWSVEDRFSPKRVYIDPFQAVWEITAEGQTVYFDAVTGEAYPIDEQTVKQSGPPSGFPAAAETGSAPEFSAFVTIPSADPFDHVYWVKGTPLAIDDAKDLMQALSRQKQTTFVNRIFGESVVLPLAVSGYQLWNDRQLYIVFSQEFGERSIFYSFAEKGEFYQR
jgi:hypothetical protein